MARIAGVDLPSNKRVEIALTYIYGVGNTTAQKIMKEFNIDSAMRAKDLPEDIVNSIRKYLENNCKVEGELHSEVANNIKRLMDIGCYRGIRHRRGLPVRGQNTKNNAKTRKKNRKGFKSK